MKLAAQKSRHGDHLRRPHPARRRLSASAFAPAPSPWSAIMPPTARRSTRAMLAGVTAAARCGGQDPDRPRRDQHRQCDQPDRAQLQFGRAHHASSISPAAAQRGSTDANIIGPNGARARVFGGSGVTYYWPSGGLRIDGNIEMAGGGLPQGRVSLRQPRAGRADERRRRPRALCRRRAAARADADPLRAGPGGSTALSTVAQLDGPFPNGRVQALRLPITGRIGRGGSFAFGTSCAVVSFNYLQMSALQLGATRLPVCPIGAGDHRQARRRPGAGQRAIQRARCSTAGSAARRCTSQAAGGQIIGQQFGFNALGMRLGQPTSPIAVRRGAARTARSSARRPQRQLRRRQGDDRQRPAAAQRRHRAMAAPPQATSASTAR